MWCFFKQALSPVNMLGIHFGQPFYLNIVSVDGDKKANNTMDSKTMVYIKSLNSPIMALVYIHSI